MFAHNCCTTGAAQATAPAAQCARPSHLAKPFGALMMQAGIDLADWASAMLEQPAVAAAPDDPRRGQAQLRLLLRWAMRNGSVQRAHRRMGVPAAAHSC